MTSSIINSISSAESNLILITSKLSALLSSPPTPTTQTDFPSLPRLAPLLPPLRLSLHTLSTQIHSTTGAKATLSSVTSRDGNTTLLSFSVSVLVIVTHVLKDLREAIRGVKHAAELKGGKKKGGLFEKKVEVVTEDDLAILKEKVVYLDGVLRVIGQLITIHILAEPGVKKMHKHDERLHLRTLASLVIEVNTSFESLRTLSTAALSPLPTPKSTASLTPASAASSANSPLHLRAGSIGGGGSSDFESLHKKVEGLTLGETMKVEGEMAGFMPMSPLVEVRTNQIEGGYFGVQS